MHLTRVQLLTGIVTAIVAGCATTPHSSGGRGGTAGDMAWAEVLDFKPDSAVVPDASVRSKMAATGLPWRVRDRASGIEMLLVPPGEFVMGMSIGDPDAMDDERPAHSVRISAPYYLGRTEVTQGEWIDIMGYNPSYFQEANYSIVYRPDRDAQIAELMAAGHTEAEASAAADGGVLVESEARRWPIETVTPADIAPFLRKTGLRLPTEAEWEFACRAGLREPRYGELDAIAWYTDNSGGQTHVVALKSPNSLGFYDMIGNVWEWCSDWYGADYYSDCAAGVTDPTGPMQSDFGVARGGSWDHVAANCRSSFRENHFMPDPRITDYGFRVARNP